MPIKVQLKDDRVLNLVVDEDRWTRVFERAMRQLRMVEIKNSDGEKLSINPNQVLYWVVEEEDPQPGREAAPAGR